MKKNIGISLLATEGANIWSSGLNQNLAFLVMLLRRIPSVGEIYLLNGGNVDALPVGMGPAIPGVALVRPESVTHEVDVVIELGAQMNGEWLRHVRALGAKIILFQVGQIHALLAEAPIFGSSGGVNFNQGIWDEIWMLPQHANSSQALVRTLSRVPVHIVPHIWDPFYLEQHLAMAREQGLPAGYQPDADGGSRRPWRTAIFEPNISVVKSCFIPMLVCEQAFRLDPESIDTMMVMNSFHMKDHPTFNAFAFNLDLTRNHKATYEPRLGFAEAMVNFRMDAVVAHHWECGLNYAYYDALYAGYPLIHNSEFLQRDGQGFFYPDFSASQGARALLDARRHDAAFWGGYRRSAAAYLQKLSPHADGNVEAFAHRLGLPHGSAS